MIIWYSSKKGAQTTHDQTLLRYPYHNSWSHLNELQLCIGFIGFASQTAVLSI